MAANAFLNPSSASTGTKAQQREEARKTQEHVRQMCVRGGERVPPYELVELIGKGSYGRVFMSRSIEHAKMVAVKIIEIDSSDYGEDIRNRDNAIKEYVNEIRILKQLKDSRAQNVNILYDAFPLQSQMWIVSEYCPGGSVHTLMKASPTGLEEQYIIPIARELAVALKSVHDAGIVHRDVKAGNVLITADGRVQLCDFGISGIMESELSKRSTFIGTPNWMPPELLNSNPDFGGDPNHHLSYGNEVDCWAFGCTLIEMATGQPPNARTRHFDLVSALMKALPKLEGDRFSEGLRDLVSFCLQEKPQDRPSADSILKHQYIANTSKRYPTTSLVEMVQRYLMWEQQGGQRQSLFNPTGADGFDELSGDPADPDDDWNFS
ncbi:kinase-like domain-containing protein, partial [Lineolata rhizophorae]